MSKIDVLLGLQWGDEAKGKIVDLLTARYDIVARFQGGPNAGHSLEFGNIKHVLHIIPSGICHKDKINLIGNGVLVEPLILKKEVETLEQIGFEPKSNLYVSKKAHLILPSHRMMDAASEQSKGSRKIGSTLKGIGPAYTDKVAKELGGSIKIVSFVRMEKGEGIEKREENFAEEVAKQIAGK